MTTLRLPDTMTTVSMPEVPLLTVEACLSLAEAAYAGDDHAAAIRHLTDACGLDPNNPALEVALGNMYLGESDFDSAAVHYRRAIALQPDADGAHGCLSLALQLQGRTEAAYKAAMEAIGLNTSNDVALKVLARIALDSRKYDRARIYCDCVLSRNGADSDALNMRSQCIETDASAGAAPSGLVGDFATRTRAWEKLGPEHVLQQFVVGLEAKRVVVQPYPSAQQPGIDGFPVPPVDLRMGYAGNDTSRYFALGQDSYRSLNTILARQSLSLGKGDAMLDWGCASGRVIRCFAPEARRGCAVWGGDVHVPSIVWAKANLTPFRFFNCSSLPHLPFADGTFKFIYALSVLTHVVALRDLWLLEISRVLQPGGCAVLTVHDEGTWTAFQKDGLPHWMPGELHGVAQMPGECVDIQGSTWNETYTFFHSDYIRRTWGQYFTVAEIVPRAESYQTAVVLRK
jgi:SAM-dependent methyltransferase